MTFMLSRRDVESAHAYASRHLSRVRRDPEGGEYKILNQVLDTAVVVGTSTAMGIAAGRFGGLNIGSTKVPIDAAGGVAAHLVAFWLDNPTFSRHIHNLGTGALAAFGSRWGMGYGGQLRAKAGMSIVPVTSMGEGEYDMGVDVIGANGASQASPSAAPTHLPMPMPVPAGPLTEAELAALAQQVR